MTVAAIDHNALSLGIEEHQRFKGPLDRLMYLRGLPNLDTLHADELMTMAQHTRERFYPAGSILAEQGNPPRAVYFVVDGQVSMRRDGLTYLTVQAPMPAGFLPLHSQDPAGTEIIADTDTLVLELGADEVHEIMENNFSFLRLGLMTLVGQLGDMQVELESRGLLQRSEPTQVPYPAQTLDIVQRLTMFRQGPYANVNLDPLAELARQAEEIRISPGDVLWREGEEAHWGMHIVYGVVSCHDDAGKRSFRMGPGSVLGYLEANAGRPRAYHAVAETKVVALRGFSEVFYDVLEDHFELGIGFMSFISDGLTGMYLKLAQATSPASLTPKRVKL